jgi:4'-phosphopantetheinyl transferase
MLKLFIIKITRDLFRSEYDQLAYSVAEEKRCRIKRYYFYIDAQRALLGDILTRYAICKEFNLSNSELSFAINQYGKPYLLSFPYVEYNISHAGQFVVCVLNDNYPVGIDVEMVKNSNLDLAKQFFTESEYRYIVNQLPEIQSEYFCQLWTMKESYIKMIGKGLSIPLDSFNVLDRASVKNAFFKQFIRDKEVVGTICSWNKEQISCEYCSYFDLLNWSKTYA